MARGDSLDGRYTRHADRRRELMDAAVAYVFKAGLADLSLRPMAKALGISHRTLLHHFGSKEEMIARVLAEARKRQLEQLRERVLSQTDPLDMLDRYWQNVSSEAREPFWRAFFEVYGVAVKNPDRYADFLDSVVKAWLPEQIRVLVAAGVPAKRAQLLATMVQAAQRGLILDLLTTGDRIRVNKAYRLLREILQQELNTAGRKSGKKPVKKQGADA